ncbi:glycosyltransferase [Svornostia abyssi]|uniref:Glycosyltransferase n=1 Tax=Svornostia abyssi TaxID=2898438 RepID=A0ABY5PK72_9ACTN|nr:glycosyltransferase [Parviterribacteraceae bacterium J379]
MRIDVVDPAAYTPPYDHALCAALARAGAQVRLQTSAFGYGDVPPAEGFQRIERFHRFAPGRPGSRVRTLARAAQHPVDMLRYRRAAADADVVHFQWLALQQVDLHLLPDRPRVLTAHDVLPREPRPGQLKGQRRLYERMDAVIVHSEHGRGRLMDEVGVPADRVHVIPHGVLDALTHVSAHAPPSWRTPIPRSRSSCASGWCARTRGSMSCCAPGRGITDAELWIVGMPRMDVAPLRAAAPPGVRWVTRFVSDAEAAACFRRASLVVLPYREIDQSGVLYTALGFGTPMVLTDVGGFGEVAAQGAAALVPPEDPSALHAELARLLRDGAARDALAAGARAAAAGPYAWDPIARRTLEIYAGITA